MSTLVDRANRSPHRLGWSVGEASFVVPDGSRHWQVDAARTSDARTILARAPSQTEAWTTARRTASAAGQDRST
ncbi:MAG: hypothetical protein ACLQNE_47155 [Thermoguttaceae bacterium]